MSKRSRARNRALHKSALKWNCVDCSTCTKLEHYFVKSSVWFDEASMPETGMLCIECLESRIGRTLTRDDFTDAHINDPRTHAMSLRLLARLTN